MVFHKSGLSQDKFQKDFKTFGLDQKISVSRNHFRSLQFLISLPNQKSSRKDFNFV